VAVLFNALNSRALVTRMAQDRTEQSSRPIMTVLTTGSASTNIWKTPALPAFFICGGSSSAGAASAAGAAASAAGAAASAAAGAAASAAAGAAGAGSAAKAGALLMSAMAPRSAMKGVVRLISSICRQFLLGLARLGRGSSRQSVSSLVNFARCHVQSPVRSTEAVIAVSVLASFSPSGEDASNPEPDLAPRRDPKVLPLC